MKTSIFLKKAKFFNSAKTLSDHIHKQFEDPRVAHSNRFVWDYWHVPHQYTLLRTPASQYFPKLIYQKFHSSVVQWGRTNLGCHDISPPWLSIYVEGCSQNLHGDLPHGPWAFVYSLTDWAKRTFSGGETLLLREEILDHWNSKLSSRGMERNDIFHEIEPLFNQLVVFDPRIPHGVKSVRGVSDPSRGRIVIHGWFVEPRPYISGPVSTSAVQQWIDSHSPAIQMAVLPYSNLQGVLTFRIQVDPSGRVGEISQLPSTLRAGFSPGYSIRALSTQIQKCLRSSPIKKASGKSEITLPLVFQTV